MFAYEIKTYNDSLERYFRDQLPSLAYVGERTHIKPIIIIPELHYEKAKDLYYKYDIDLTIGVITYNDKMTFKRQTNISYTYRLQSDGSYKKIRKENVWNFST